MFTLPPSPETTIRSVCEQADGIIFDVDDTLIMQDPIFTKWIILRCLAEDHDPTVTYGAEMHVDAYLTETEAGSNENILDTIRSISKVALGDTDTLERVATNCSELAADGIGFSKQLRSLPCYTTGGQSFWNTRARILSTSSAPASTGRSILPGTNELIAAVLEKNKYNAIISNSRSGLIIPLLDELIAAGSDAFAEIMGLGGTSIAPKPSPESAEVLRRKLGLKTPLYIGNAIEDVQFGENAAMPTIIYNTPFVGYASAYYTTSPKSLLETIRWDPQ